jgi:hypothetical protein
VTGLGFRVKSGYAVAVVLAGRAASPAAIARCVVELSDPKVPGTRQPYHDGFFKQNEDAREIARLVKIVERCAQKAVAAFVAEARRAVAEPGGPMRAGLVVGSVIDPAKVGNPHIRAHANEGRLFRSVLEDALRAEGIDSSIVVDKQLAATAANGLRLSGRDIARALTQFGKTLGSPWRAEEKAAATAAWLALRAD